MPFPKLIHLHDNTEYAIKDGEEFTLGRSLDSSFVSDSIEISRHHCKIKKSDGKWILQDTSMNGTLVNSTLVKSDQCELHNGDIIKLAIDNLDFIFCTQADNNESKNESDQTVNRVNNEDVHESNTEEVEELLAAANEELDKPFDYIDLTESPTKVKATPVPLPIVSIKSEPNNDLEAIEDELTCSICSELFIKAVTLSCAHTFCNYCIEQWRKNKHTCPICRKVINSSTPTLVLDNFINKKLESMSEKVKANRAELIKDREKIQAEANPKPSTSVADASIEITVDDDDDDDIDEDNASDNYDDYDSSNEPSRFWSESSDYDYDEDDDNDSYNGLPGHYYGGYGSCYSCGQRGHWSRGCPNKRRRI